MKPPARSTPRDRSQKPPVLQQRSSISDPKKKTKGGKVKSHQRSVTDKQKSNRTLTCTDNDEEDPSPIDIDRNGNNSYDVMTEMM